MSALTPCRIWFVTVSEPANEEVNLTSWPCDCFHLAAKPGIIPFSIDSVRIEKA
jgi:hypothetical protein